MRFVGKKEVVRKVQSYFPNLKKDGVDGPATWNTILTYLRNRYETASSTPDVKVPSRASLAKKMVILARAEVGVEEVNGSNCGPRVNEYKSATWLDPDKGWPWCAAFICWLFRESMKGKKYSFSRPETAGAFDFENWCKKQDKSVILKRSPGHDIQAGDIIIFKFSHIGIATSSPDSNGYFKTVEGNTDSDGSREGGGVFAKQRRLSQVRSRIRPMV